MTGELFSVLRQHSVLGRLMPPDADFHAGAFDEGLRRSSDESGLGLSWDLFSVRARALMRQLEATALPDYLSGLLVGNEVAGGPHQSVARKAVRARLSASGRSLPKLNAVPPQSSTRCGRPPRWG